MVLLNMLLLEYRDNPNAFLNSNPVYLKLKEDRDRQLSLSIDKKAFSDALYEHSLKAINYIFKGIFII